MSYKVCDSCAVALSNADMSHIDSPEMEETMTRNIESMGRVAQVGVIHGYLDCEVCEQLTIDGYIYERNI